MFNTLSSRLSLNSEITPGIGFFFSGLALVCVSVHSSTSTDGEEKKFRVKRGLASCVFFVVCTGCKKNLNQNRVFGKVRFLWGFFGWSRDEKEAENRIK